MPSEHSLSRKRGEYFYVFGVVQSKLSRLKDLEEFSLKVLQKLLYSDFALYKFLGLLVS